MKTNLTTVDAHRLFDIFTSMGSIKVKDAKIEHIEFDISGNLKWQEGGVPKTFALTKIAKFFERECYEVYKKDDELELLMWDEITLDKACDFAILKA